jgi:hypothetical protein
MALSLSVTHKSPMPGGALILFGTVTFDSSYPTGGETLDVSAYFTGSPHVFLSQDDGYHIFHDKGTAAAGKLLVHGTGSAEKAAGTQVDNATDLSSVVCHIIVVGQAV